MHYLLVCVQHDMLAIVRHNKLVIIRKGMPSNNAATESKIG